MGNWTQGKKAPRMHDADGKRTVPEIVPTPDEEWRAVPGFEGLYSASSCGRVRSDRPMENGKMLSQTYKGQDGYLGVCLVRSDGSKSWPMVATVIALTFHGPRLAGMQIDHRDANKLNNAAANLEYVTVAENHRRATEKGLHPFGERHHAAKLTEADVREIRDWNGPQREVMEAFGVSRSTVQAIQSRRTWKRVA